MGDSFENADWKALLSFNPFGSIRHWQNASATWSVRAAEWTRLVLFAEAPIRYLRRPLPPHLSAGVDVVAASFAARAKIREQLS